MARLAVTGSGLPRPALALRPVARVGPLPVLQRFCHSKEGGRWIAMQLPDLPPRLIKGGVRTVARPRQIPGGSVR